MARAETTARYRERHQAEIVAFNREYRRRPEVRERNRLRTARYRRTEHGAAVRRAHNEQMDPVKLAARHAATRAIKNGTLVRQPCFCGRRDSHAHHHNGYDEGHVMDVVWLCPVHHSEAHRGAR